MGEIISPVPLAQCQNPQCRLLYPADETGAFPSQCPECDGTVAVIVDIDRNGDPISAETEPRGIDGRPLTVFEMVTAVFGGGVEAVRRNRAAEQTEAERVEELARAAHELDLAEIAADSVELEADAFHRATMRGAAEREARSMADQQRALALLIPVMMVAGVLLLCSLTYGVLQLAGGW